MTERAAKRSAAPATDAAIDTDIATAKPAAVDAARVSHDSCVPLAGRVAATLGHFTAAQSRDRRTT